MAGLTVGAVVVPQSLAYAELAGMPPVTGLYAALAAMAAYAVVGSSPHTSLGPTATSAVLAVAAGTSLTGGREQHGAALAALAVVAGSVALAAGAARLGFVSHLLSRPVLAGYTAGAAVIIVVGQLGTLLGIETGRGADGTRPHRVIADLAGSLDEASVLTLVVGATTVVALAVLGRLVPRLPAALLVVVAATLTAAVLDLRAHGVATVGQVPGGLPGLDWPDLTLGNTGSLVAAAAGLALVGFAETTAQGRALTLEGATPPPSAPLPPARRGSASALSPNSPSTPAAAPPETSASAPTSSRSARPPSPPEPPPTSPRPAPAISLPASPAASPRTSPPVPPSDGPAGVAGDGARRRARLGLLAGSGGRSGLDPNRELLALGAANVASGVCGGFPVSSSFSRNAVNLRAGGRTRRSGAVSAAVVALTLVALTGLLDHLPRATLAGIVVVAVASLVRVRTFRRLQRLQRDDFAYAVVALIGTVALGVLPGLAVAVALSIGGLLYRVTVVDTAVLGYVAEQDTWRRLDRHSSARTVPGVAVLRFEGPLYFANATRLQREVTELVAEAPGELRRVVVDGRAVSHLDVTAMDMLTELHAGLARHGIDLVLAGLRGPALDAFLRTDLVRTVGREHIVYPTVRQATGLDPATEP